MNPPANQHDQTQKQFAIQQMLEALIKASMDCGLGATSFALAVIYRSLRIDAMIENQILTPEITKSLAYIDDKFAVSKAAEIRKGFYDTCDKTWNEARISRMAQPQIDEVTENVEWFRDILDHMGVTTNKKRCYQEALFYI